ncbi:MAG: hypothetical protein ACRDD1_03010 [Planctomycetia bacterium]
MFQIQEFVEMGREVFAGPALDIKFFWTVLCGNQLLRPLLELHLSQGGMEWFLDRESDQNAPDVVG